MSWRLDISRIAGAVDALERMEPEARVLALKNLADNNGGRLDLPSEARGPDGAPIYDPLIKSVEVFGVYAMADKLDELPKNWMLAARNILSAADDEDAEVA